MAEDVVRASEPTSTAIVAPKAPAATPSFHGQREDPVVGKTRPRAANGVTPLAAERTEFLVGVLGGGAALARILGVSRSQPTRWRSGAEQPGPEAARGLVDLDHVMARALMLFPQRVAADWLTSSNAFLDGARPIDVLETRGSAEVIDALDATAAGAFA